MSRVMILAKTTMLENSRKQVFHVVTLLTLAIVCASTMLSFFTLGVQTKILKDLCTTSMLFCGGILAIALAATAIPGEIESRTCYPILARPLRRTELLLGKFFGTLLTVYAGLAFIALVFALLLASKQAFSVMVLITIGFTFLEVAVIAAITMCISTFSGPAIASMLSLMIYVAGTIKIEYFKPMVDKVTEPVTHFIARGVYHLLPNLESFNFKDSLVHGLPVPSAYLAQVAVYGVCYTALALAIAGIVFSKREL